MGLEVERGEGAEGCGGSGVIPQPGDVITCVDATRVVAHRVYRDAAEALDAHQHLGGPWVVLAYFYTGVHEGVHWCRGVEGPQVDALRVAQALK